MEITVAGMERPVYIEYKRNRNMYLRLNEDGSLHVTCPRWVNAENIRTFILEKEHWIVQNEKTMEKRHSATRTGLDGVSASWLGEEYQIEVIESHKSFMFIDDEAKTILFFLKENTPQEREKVFYREGAKMLKAMIEGRREEWDQKICIEHQKPLPKITVKYMTSRWGSCTPARSHISMSVRLIHYPKECLDYVLLHEYVHLLVPNHSKTFYRLVEQNMPAWKTYSDELK